MPDLASLVLRLRPTHVDDIPAWTGRAAHAWFLASLRRIEPALATIVHDSQGAKPFTVSSLLGVEGGPLIRLQPDHAYALRVTTLHADLTALTLHGLVPQWLSDGVVLHDQPLRVERISVDPVDDPWAGTADYTGLLEQHTLNGAGRHPKRQITFTFASPTAFRRTGGTILPLPLPELVFGSLIERWAQYAPVALDPDLRQFIAERVVLSHHNIRTQHISFERASRGAVTGFVGRATFTVQSAEPHWLQQMAILAAFARYSGIGVRTTMGLGQARARLQQDVAVQ